MSNKKIIMTALGVGILSTISIVSVIDSNAWGNNESGGNTYIGRMVWNSNDTNNGRYQAGHFNGAQVMRKNPTLANGGYIGSGSSYTKNSNQKVRTAVKSGYNYDILYYEPYATGSGSWYTSPQADGVDENYYSHYYNAISGYMHKISWGGSKTNFSNKESKPNDSNKANYTNAGSKVTNAYDSRFGKVGEWRYLGYGIDGSIISNPFFPADEGAFTGHRSDAGIMNQDIHGQYGSNKARKYLDLSHYDKYEYPSKINAIKRLMNADTSFKNGTITQVNDATGKTINVVNNGNISAELWANSLSLVTDPDLETPIFSGHRKSGSRYVGVIGVTDDKLLSELQIKSVILKDINGNLIKRFDRNSEGGTSTSGNGSVSPGQQVKIQYVIENTGKNWTTVNPSKVQAGVAYGDNAYKNDYNSKYSYNESNWTIQGGGKIAPGQSVTLPEQTITVDSNASGAFRVTGYMHEDYIKSKEAGVASNDWGHVVVNVKEGDTGLSNIEILDRSGNPVQYMKPGEEYKTRYTFKYTGPDVRFQDYYWEKEWCSHSNSADSHWSYSKVYYDVWKDFNFSWTATRYLPGGGSEIFRDSDTKSINTLKNGTTWTYETPYFVYQVPKADASASLKAPTEGTDSNSTNNSGSKHWEYKYDIIVSNVRVYNKNERPTQNGTITLGLKYDVELITPTNFPYFETDVKTHVTLPNGKVLQFTDHLKQGKNPDITREIQVPVEVITSGSKNLNVGVFANADKQFWEIDLSTQSNNKGSDSTVQLPPINPNVSRGCSVIKNNNNFGVNHSINNYSGSLVKWSRFDNSATYSFYKYGNGSKSITTKSYNETYKINSVKFKSKDTADKGYGTNGWVDLTKASEKDKAIIKAGYGYELAIEVEYKTNALANQPKAYDTRNNSTSRGTTVTNLNNKANVYKDIYVRTSDGKTLSATGMYGTIPAFDVTTVTSNENTTVLRYTMKNTTQNGVSTPVKIYTSENAKDGSYGLTVWTPTITGVGNPQKPSTNLCDEEGVKYTIKGSMYDDNQDSIIQ